MNTKNIVIGIVVVIVLALVGWYFFYNKGYQPTPTPDQTDTSTDTTSGAPAAGSLRALTTKGGNYTCTFSSSTDTGKTTGTIYASGSKMRLDFNLEIAPYGTRITTHTIRLGTDAYTWVEGGQPTGVKTVITTTSKVVPQPSGATVSPIGDDTPVASDCHPWVPDTALLTPPTTITFVAQ